MAVWAWMLGFAPAAQAQSDTLLSAAQVVAAARGVRSAGSVQRADTAVWRRMAVSSTADALRRMAGITLRDYGGAGGLKTVSVRGLGAGHTAVVYDGLTVGNAQQGHIDIGRFPLDRLSAIELHTADSPTLLTPVRQQAAATLVLQPLRPDSACSRLQGQTALRQGSFGLWRPSVLLYGTRRRTTLSLSADLLHARNDYPFHVSNGVASHNERRINSQANDHSLEAAARHSLPHGSLDASIHANAEHRYLPGAVTLYTNRNHEHTTSRNAFAQVRWQHNAVWRLQAAAKADWNESRYLNRDAQYPDGRLFLHYIQRETYATAGAARAVGPQFTAAVAADVFANQMSSNQPSDNGVHRLSALGSLSVRYAAPRLEVTARLIGAHHRDRATDTPQRHSRLCPALSAAWTLAGGKTPDGTGLRLLLRTAYKEFYRMPTFTELYYFHYGSPTLSPELTRQFSAGLTAQAGGPLWLLSFTADAYRNSIRDKISSLPVNLYVWRTVNLGRVRADGLDLTLSGTFRPAQRQQLALRSQLTLLHSTDRTRRGTAAYGRQTAYVPRTSGAASVSWENPWLCAALSVTASGSRWATNEHTPTTSIAGYADWNAALWRTLPVGRTSLELRAEVTNLFGKDYAVIRRYPMPRRAYTLSAAIRF